MKKCKCKRKSKPAQNGAGPGGPQHTGVDHDGQQSCQVDYEMIFALNIYDICTKDYPLEPILSCCLRVNLQALEN